MAMIRQYPVQIKRFLMGYIATSCRRYCLMPNNRINISFGWIPMKYCKSLTQLIFIDTSPSEFSKKQILSRYYSSDSKSKKLLTGQILFCNGVSHKCRTCICPWALCNVLVVRIKNATSLMLILSLDKLISNIDETAILKLYLIAFN